MTGSPCRRESDFGQNAVSGLSGSQRAARGSEPVHRVADRQGAGPTRVRRSHLHTSELRRHPRAAGSWQLESVLYVHFTQPQRPTVLFVVFRLAARTAHIILFARGRSVSAGRVAVHLARASARTDSFRV